MTVVQKGIPGDTYNVGGENQPTNLHIVDMICGILDDVVPNSPYKPHKSLIEFVEDRPGHDRRYAMDITKIKKELNWSPKETLESGLRLTIDWYLNNDAWLAKIEERPTYQEWMEQNYAGRGEG
jgi:dTDP-glucose 4,6-dehydratase